MKIVRFVITCPGCSGVLWVEAEIERLKEQRYSFRVRHVDGLKRNLAAQGVGSTMPTISDPVSR